MNTEEKAKAYDEALKLMRDCVPDEDGLVHVRPSDIFSELKESKDEKTRKEIVGYLKKNLRYEWATWLEKQGTSYTKMDVDDAFVEGMAFAKYELEKQGKQILANSAKTCKDEQKPALDIEIPFGAKDSELQEATYLIPEGFHAEIKNDEVFIKKGKHKRV